MGDFHINMLFILNRGEESMKRAIIGANLLRGQGGLPVKLQLIKEKSKFFKVILENLG